MSRYKYVCEECGEATFFNARERTRVAGMLCRFCGSRRLNPSKRSFAKHNIPIFHSIKKDFDKQLDEKRKGLKEKP